MTRDKEPASPRDLLRQHPTEANASQRGMSWQTWLAERPPSSRTLSIIVFVLVMGWISYTRWSSCAAS